MDSTTVIVAITIAITVMAILLVGGYLYIASSRCDDQIADLIELREQERLAHEAKIHSLIDSLDDEYNRMLERSHQETERYKRKYLTQLELTAQLFEQLKKIKGDNKNA